MAVVATGELAVTPDLKGFESKLSSSLGGIAKRAAAAFGGVFAAQKGLQTIGGAIEAARESNRVAAQTAAVLKSTGGAANVTAKGVDELASAISRKTGIDDEQIAKASNLLLTFTNIKNAAGENNDIFNQATKIATDMGAALGTDAAGSAIQLGKALNDPIKGISALTRVGVTFSDAQKEQIKTFVETGRVADAQKVILAELAKEFGGSAEAQATAGDRLRVTIGNIQEDIGNKLVPIVDKAATFLADKLPAAMEFVGGVIRKVSPFFKTLSDAVGAFFYTLTSGFTQDEGTKIEGLALSFRKVFEAVKDTYEDQIKPLARFLVATVVPVVADLGDKLVSLVGFFARNIDTIKKVAAVIGTLLIPHFVKLGIAATVSAAKQVAAWVTTKAQAIAATFASSAQFAIQIGRWVALGVAATANAAVIAAAWLVSLGPIALVGAAVVGLVALVVTNWDTIKNAIVTAATFVLDFLKANWPTILAILTGPIGLVVLAIVRNWDTIKDATSTAFEFVKGVVTGAINTIKGIFETFGKGLGTIWDTFKNAAKTVFNAIAKLWNNTVGRLSFKVPSWVPGIGGKGWDVPDIPVMHDGGVFQAPFGQREGLALLRSGERVLPTGVGTSNVFQVSVTFAGTVPTEEQAYTAGRAVGRGAAYEMERADARRAARTA